MPLVDDRGRLFGRFNLIDAVVGVFALGLIPLLYGAAALFWTPLPTLQAIEPASVNSGAGQFVTIRGQNLRPYMRVSFGTIQGKDFLFKSTQEALINLNEMPPGEYDVVLYDVAQEQARLPKAFKVLPPLRSQTKMTLVGVFGNLDANSAKTLTVGTVVAGVGTIRKVGEPMPAKLRVNSNGLLVHIPVERTVMLPVEVEADCDVRSINGDPYCQSGGITLQSSQILFGEHAGTKLPFQIDQVRSLPALEPIEVQVHFAGAASIIGLIRSGDVDRGLFGNVLAAGATVLSVKTNGPADATVRLRLGAERGSNGWVYMSASLRAGGSLMFRTPRYELLGVVEAVTPEWTAPAPQ